MPDPIYDAEGNLVNEPTEQTAANTEANESNDTFLDEMFAREEEETGVTADDLDVESEQKTITDAEDVEADAYEIEDATKLDVGTDIDTEIEAKQETMSMISRAVSGGTYKGVNTILENVGYLADVPEMFGFDDEFEEGYTNWLSEWASENKKEYDEYNPIYGDSAFAQTMQGLQGLVDSTVGFAATGAGVGALVGKGVQLLNGMVKAGFMTEAAIARVGTAVATNYAESTMMAAELHENVMKNAIANGVDAREAVKVADKQAQEFILQNKMNIMTDVFTLRTMSKGQGIISGAMNKSNKQKLVGGLLDAGGEAFEEMSSGFLQKDNERDAALELKTIVDDNTSFASRAGEYATSKEGIKEGLMGAIGGPFQHLALKGATSGINAAKTKFGIISKVNDPGDFSEKAPVLGNITESKPRGKKPLTTAEKYMKTAANTSKKQAESFTTDEERAADEAAHKAWLSSGTSAEDATANQEKFDAETKLYEGRKASHQSEKKKYEEYVYEKKMGTKAKAKEDIQEFLTNDNDLRKKYHQAFIDGDKSKMSDIENDRFEGLFMRYADRGMTDGLSEQLKEIAQDPNSTAEQKEFAMKYQNKIEDYSKQYMSEFNKHGRSKGNETFKLKRRVESTKEALADLNREMDKSSITLSQEMLNTTGKTISPIQTEIISLQAEQRQLEQMKRKLSVMDNSVLQVEFDKKEKAITDRIAELDKDFTTGKLSESEIKNLDGYKKFEDQAKQRTDAWVAHTGYKKSYEYISSPKYATALKKKNFDHLMNEVNTNTFNDKDVAVNLAMSSELEMTDKQTEEFMAALDAVSLELSTEKEENTKEVADKIKAYEDFDKQKDQVTQSTLDAWDERLKRRKDNFSKQDEKIAKAKRRFLDSQAKEFQSLKIPGEGNKFVDKESVRNQYKEQAANDWLLFEAAKKEKADFIIENNRKIKELEDTIASNAVKKQDIRDGQNTIATQLESYDTHISADSFAFRADRFLDKVDDSLKAELITDAAPIETERSDFPPGHEQGGGPVQAFGSGKKSPSQVKAEMAIEAKDGGVKNHSNPFSNMLTKHLEVQLDSLEKQGVLPDSEAEAKRVGKMEMIGQELDSRKNGKGKPGHGEAVENGTVNTIQSRFNPDSKPSQVQEIGPDNAGDPGPQAPQEMSPFALDDDGGAIGSNPNEQPPMHTMDDAPQGGPTPMMEAPGAGPVVHSMGSEVSDNQPPVPDFSEPGSGVPDHKGVMTPGDNQAGVQVVKDMGLDDDGAALSTALSHLATAAVVDAEPDNGAIAVTDMLVPDETPAIDPAFNEASTNMNKDWPWSMSYQSTSDGRGDKNNSGLVDWLETTTDMDKRGYKVRYEVQKADRGFAPEVMDKYQKGEVLTDAELSELPIRMVIYNEDGSKVKHNEKEVYGWMKRSAYFKGDAAVEQSVLDGRRALVNAFAEGGTFENTIERVGSGKLHSTPGERKNPTNYLSEKKLVVSDGIGLVDQDRKPVAGLNQPYNVRGFVFLQTKDANGRPFPLKLNSRRLSGEETNTIYRILEKYRDGANANSKAELPGIGGLKYAQVLDLLIFSGNNSKITEYPFVIDSVGRKFTFGEKTIKLSEIEQHRDEIVKYVASMWRTTNIPMMNKPMSSVANSNFTWFGKDIDVHEMSYNDFQYADEALSTNADFPSGRLFVNPSVITGKPESWKKVGGKQNVTSEAMISEIAEADAAIRLESGRAKLKDAGITLRFLKGNKTKVSQGKKSIMFNSSVEALDYVNSVFNAITKKKNAELTEVAKDSKDNMPSVMTDKTVVIKKDAKSNWNMRVKPDGSVSNRKTGKPITDKKLINKAHLKSGHIKFTSVKTKKGQTYAVTADYRIINITPGSKSNGNEILATSGVGKEVLNKVDLENIGKPKAVAIVKPVVPVVQNESPDFQSKTPPVQTAPEAGETPGVPLSGSIFNKPTSKDTATTKVDTPTTPGKKKNVLPTKRGKGKNKKDKHGIKTSPKGAVESKIIKPGVKVDAAAEVRALKKMLPHVPVNIIEGLISSNQGGVAEGYFYDGVVAISDMGNKGVAFHEGFHAVMSGYLTTQERSNLLEEGRKRFGKNESDQQIEEILAEEFREYMAQKGEMKVPSTFKWLYNMIQDIVNLFRSKNRSVFSKMRAGRFDYTPPYAHSAEIAFSELLGNPKQAMIRDAVETLTYRVVSFSGVRSSDNASRMYESIDEILDDVYDSVVDDMEAADNAGDQDTYDNLASLLLEDETLGKSNWDSYSQLVKDEITSLDLKLNKEDTTIAEDNEDEASGELNIKQALLFSGKDNASNNTKMMVKMIKDPSVQSKYFGPGFERLANFATSWRILENTMAGMVNTSNSTQVEKMLGAIEVLSGTHPEFNELLSQLKETDPEIVPEYKKVQFYRAFSKQNVLYNHAQVTEVDGDFTWMIGNADSQSHAHQLRAEWSEGFKNLFVKGGTFQKADRERLQKVVQRMRDFDQMVQDGKRSGQFDPRSYKMLSSIFSDLGINISPESFKAYISTNDSKSEGEKFFQVFSYRLRGVILNSSKNPGTNLEKMLSSGYEYDEDNTFINTYNSVFGPLSVNEGFQQKETLENMVMGPEGNLYWTKSLNNNITKKMAEWKADPAEMTKMLSSQYHKKSKWLAWLSGYEMNHKLNEDGSRDTVETKEGLASKSKQRLHALQTEVFLSNRLDDGSDMGTSYAGMNTVDATVDSLNRTLYGVRNANMIGSTLSPLTFADKSSFYMFSGIPIENYGLDERGASDTAVNTMYNYFLAEYERISFSGKNKTNNKFFDNVGSQEFFWFPEMNQGTKLAKSIGLYNKDGKLNPLTKERKAMVLQHVNNAIKERIENMKEEMKNKSILTEDSDGDMMIEGMDDGILSYYGRKNSNHNDAMNNLISDYVINSMVSNIEYTMLFAGDPAFYKDLSKRTPSAIATGIDLINLGKEPTHFNAAVVADVEEKSSLYDDYLEEFKRLGVKDAEQVLSPYLALEKADAQAYITPSRFKSLMKQLGEWEPKHDEAYARLERGDRDVDPKDLLMMQPLKGMHYELTDNQSGFLTPVYLKYSQAVLWPALVRNSPGNKNLLAQMEADDIQEVIFNTGVKVGAQSVANMGDVLSGNSKKGHFKPMRLSNSHWKLQQDLPSKYAKTGTTLVGSQVRKNIKANILGDDNNPRSFKVDGVTVDGKTLADMIDSVESQLSDIGRHAFTEKYKVVDSKITNTEPIFEHLEEKLKKDKVDSNILGQLGKPGSRPDLDLLFQYKEKIEQELFSELNKATTKLTAPGGSFIQMSGSGFTGMKSMTANDIDLNGITALQDIDTFKGPRKGPNGTIAADVMIPYNDVKHIPGWEKMGGAALKRALGDTITDLVGYRIPNQGMSSIDLFNVVGILPPTAGDSMVVYDEITGKTGSDFDIDKMYVLMHHTEWNPKTGKLERVTSGSKPKKGDSKVDFERKLLENERMKLWAAVLTSPDTYVDLVTPLDANWLRDEAYYIDLLGADESTKSEFVEFLANMKDPIETTFDGYRTLPNKEELANKFAKQRKGRSLQTASPQEQMDLKNKNIAGKSGVGQTANHLVHHALMQQVGEAAMLNADGNKITEIVSAWLNAYVDNAKDPYISLLNNNTFTANAVFFLLRKGVSPHVVNRLMASPIIKEYANQHFISRSKLIGNNVAFEEHTAYSIKTVHGTAKIISKQSKGRPTPFTKTIKKFGLKPSKTNITKTNEIESMTAEQLEDMMMNPTEESNIGLLTMFEAIKKEATEFNKIVKATKFDTNGAGLSNVENFTTDLLIADIRENNDYADVYEKVIEETFMKAMKENSHQLGREVYGDLLFSGSEAVRNAIVVLNARVGSNGTDLEMNQKIVKDYYSYLYSSGFDKKATEAMFYGNKTMAHKLRFVKNKYPDNKLIKTLNTDVSTKEHAPSFITFPSSKKKDTTEINELWTSWDELLSDSSDLVEGYKVSDFAEDLIHYAYVGSGFNKNINSFYDLIPHTYTNGDFKGENTSFADKIAESKRNSTDIDFNFMDQFMRHNWTNKSFVPNVGAGDNALKNISNKITKKSSGFVVGKYKMPDKMNIGSKKSPAPVQYVTLSWSEENAPGSFSKVTSLYKLQGTKSGDFYYKKVSKLGMKEKGNNITEYSHGQEVKDSVVRKNTGAKVEFTKSTFGLQETNVSAKLPVKAKFETKDGVTTVRGVDTFKFKTEEFYDKEAGQMMYKLVAFRPDGVEVAHDSFSIEATAEDALFKGLSTIEELGREDLLLSLNNAC